MRDESGTLRQLASGFLERGDWAEAAVQYELLLRQVPDDLEALANLGVIRLELGHPDQALPPLSRAVAVSPDLAFLHLNLSNALLALGRLEEGLASSEAAIRCNPALATAHNNKGSALRRLGRVAEATVSFREALRRDPACVPALNNLGVALAEGGDWQAAVDVLRRVVAMKPDHIEATASLGRCLIELGEFGLALDAFRQALATCPDSSALRHDLATLFLRQGNTVMAETLLEELHTEQPSDDEVRLNLALLYSLNKKPAKTLALLDQLDSASAAQDKAIPLRLEAQLDLCDWRDFQTLREGVKALARRDARFVTPLTLMRCIDDPQLQREVAACYANQLVGTLPRTNVRHKVRSSGPLRVAYVSPDFGDHPVAQSVVELMECHDRSRVQVFGISTVTRHDSPMLRRLTRACDHFEQAGEQPDAAIAALLADRDVDIAVDLGGLTRGARPRVLAARPARVQVSYLGFPGSMGCSWIDYVIGDEISLPEALAPAFSEHLVQLPTSFFPSDTTEHFVRRRTRRHFGLREDRILLIAPVSPRRLLPELFDCWLRILHRVPDTVLCLPAGPAIRDSILLRAARSGLGTERFQFLEPLPDRADYLERLSLADLGLDLAPYGGHSTMRDALWAGLPMLTIEGRSFAARIGASLLRHAGLDDWVSTNISDYEALAIRAAQDSALRDQARQRLREPRALTLFDTPALSRALEAAYYLMIDRWQHDFPPAPIRPADLSVVMKTKDNPPNIEGL